MKFNSVIFYTLLSLSISQLTFSFNVLAQNQKNVEAERWFEIEVILFKQLGDKTELKEQFPDGINASILPKYKKSFDLFNAYLQPNLTGIKQFMPMCDEQIDTAVSFDLLPNIDNVNEDQNIKIIIANFQETINEAPPQITQTNELENTSPPTLELDFTIHQADLAKPIFATDKLCIITLKEMESLLNKEQLSHFNIDAFGVDALPSRLSALGLHNSEQPYLIADESLLLKDISQNLRWSREFQPLLHFGWRQIGITEKDAIPLKLVAGEHVDYQYQQTLNQYKTKLNETSAIEGNLLEDIDQNEMSASQVLKINLTQKQQALSQLFSRLNALQKNTLNKALDSSQIDTNGLSTNDLSTGGIDSNAISDIVERISKQDINSLVAHKSNNHKNTNHDSAALEPNNAPKAPLQPWFLDGFFKVHLDHYLYITADFNLFNQDPVSDTHVDKVKLINFSQNRRVITGEIHYFDHPYIGMIVQIRRFDPTQPIGERVSQSIK